MTDRVSSQCRFTRREALLYGGAALFTTACGIGKGPETPTPIPSPTPLPTPEPSPTARPFPTVSPTPRSLPSIEDLPTDNEEAAFALLQRDPNGIRASFVNGDVQSVKELDAMVTRLTLRRARFYQERLGGAEVKNITADSIEMTYPKPESFNLADPTQRILASAMLEVWIAKKIEAENQGEVFDIVSLQNKISFQDGRALLFPRAWSLDTLCKTVDLLKAKGVNYPKKWEAVTAADAGYLKDSGVVRFGWSYLLGGLGLHALATRPDLASKFSDKQNFLGLYTDYLTGGQRLRNNIAYRNTVGDGKGKIMAGGYQAIKDSLGFETLTAGIPRWGGEFKVGEQAMVNEYDVTEVRSGIILKEELTTEIDPSLPSVKTGDYVRVLSRPQQLIYDRDSLHYPGEALEMVRVEVINEEGWQGLMPVQYISPLPKLSP